MDWKAFMAQLVSSLAWPSVAVVILAMFRSEVSRIIQRLAHLKYKELELDFEKVKERAEAIHEEIRGEVPVQRSPVLKSVEDQILDAAERAPAAAIVLAWSGLETAMASAVARLGISSESSQYISPIRNIRVLSKRVGLPPKYLDLLHEMRDFRNRVAHGSDVSMVSETQALNYAQAALDMIGYFEKLARE